MRGAIFGVIAEVLFLLAVSKADEATITYSLNYPLLSDVSFGKLCSDS